jgi:hypothetical protein
MRGSGIPVARKVLTLGAQFMVGSLRLQVRGLGFAEKVLYYLPRIHTNFHEWDLGLILHVRGEWVWFSNNDFGKICFFVGDDVWGVVWGGGEGGWR